MNRLQKFLALGAVVAASSSLAFADQISVDAFGTYTTSTITFDSTGIVGPASAESGVFSQLAGGTATFTTTPLDYAAASSFPATEIFSIVENGVTATFDATGDAPTSPTGLFTPPNASDPALLDLGIAGYGYFTFSNDPGVEIPATFTLTSQDGANASDGSSNMTVSISGTAMTTAVTPEPNSLVLMGTGFIGAAALLFMRRRQAGLSL